MQSSDKVKHYWLYNSVTDFGKMSAKDVLEQLVLQFGADEIYQYLKDFYGWQLEDKPLTNEE